MEKTSITSIPRDCPCWNNGYNGIASVLTISRLLSSIDEEMFCLAFIEWMTEITQLLELTNINKSIVTIDAIGTTKPIIESIEKEGGHFLLTVKKSNPLTY